MMATEPTPATGPMATAARIEALLNGFPASKWDSKAQWEARMRELQVLILNEGGAFKDDWQGARLQLQGYRATCTHGLAGACRNWITQVRAKAQPAEVALN
jgi:hypothetical protein